MFERFTAPAREVVTAAQHEARALGHDYLGTEHLVLGMLGDEEGLAGGVLRRLGVTHDVVRTDVLTMVGTRAPRGLDADALATIGIDLDEVRRRVEDAFGPGALERTRAGCPDLRFTPKSKRALEEALRAATKRGDGFIGTEHVLLGVLRVRDSVGAAILRERGVTTEQVLDRLAA